MQSQATVYHVSIDDYDESLLTYLNQSDQEKAQRFNAAKRKQSFISGRALLAYALNELTGSTDYQLSYTTHGKPQLIFPKNLFFSISHSGREVFLLIYQSPVAIDCEQLKERNFAAIIDFLPQLKSQYKNSNNALVDFYLAWTRYEAQTKLLGQSVFSAASNNQFITASFITKNVVLSIVSTEPLTYDFYSVNFNSNQTSPYPVKPLSSAKE